MSSHSSEKKEPTISVASRKSSSDDSSASGALKSPRTARFAEATSVDSPADNKKMPFSEPVEHTTYYAPQAQVADIGFGYIGKQGSHESVEMPASPRSPLKSALKSPGQPPRDIPQQNPLSPRFADGANPLSPTWKEEKRLEKNEKRTEKQQKNDLRIKVRIRMAKMMLRGTNFACSLIVLSMLSSTFSIFNATKALPPRNNLPPWAAGTNPWPQILLLVIACISLFMSVVIFWAYFRGGHRRAEKAAVYYTTFSVLFFAFSIIMWGIGAGILQGAKNNSNGQDIWGWSCKDNTRKALFESEVSYSLICRLQNWSLVCAIIEIVVETITILIYGIVFYRFYSKRRLRKTMEVRDRARSDLYLAQLRSQTAPNTPGLPMSPRDGGYNPMFSPRFAPGAADAEKGQASIDGLAAAEQGDLKGQRFVTAPAQPQPQKPFTLQAPPTKDKTPKMQQKATFEPASAASSIRAQTPVNQPQMAQQVVMQQAHAVSIPPPPMSPGPMSPMYAPQQTSQPVHTPAAPGEQQYGAVPIPGAYASPLTSPTFAPTQLQR